MDKKKSILMEAQKIVHGARRKDYGHPLDNHTRTAEMWNQYLNRRWPGIQLTAEDVCMMNIIQKVARCATTGRITRDTIVDTAGYAANVELIWDEREYRAKFPPRRKR